MLKILKLYRGRNEAPSTGRLRYQVPEEVPRQWQALPEREVVFREGGGVSVLGSPEGTLHFTVDGVFAFRTARIRGTELALRFSTSTGTDAKVNVLVAARDGRPVEVENVLSRREDGLTPRMPFPDVDGAWAQWRYNKAGAPLEFEMPLVVEGEPLEVRVRVEEGHAGGEPRYAVLGPDSDEVAEGFTVCPMIRRLAGELSEGFMVTETVSGRTWHFPAVGQAQYVDEPGRERRPLGSGPAPSPRKDGDAASASSPVRASAGQSAEEGRSGAPDDAGDATDLPHGAGISAPQRTTLPEWATPRSRKRRR